ncbi:unnamed protein product [Strongylus vulgaris]|uniref:Uncharacterized protein n=1 Tax=Strongylus vulgaris TaxID=40348 RepID=A0A3P7J2Y3_STRVU|nr:unnamed protein product [Strongylus vulgaris]
MASALSCGLLAIVLALRTLTTLANVPALHLYNGHIPIEQPAANVPIQQLVVGQPYTFEIYMENVERQDYMVETCSLNGRTFIDSNGYVRTLN